MNRKRGIRRKGLRECVLHEIGNCRRFSERSIYARQARSLQNTKEVSDNRTTSNTDTLGKNPLSLYRTASNFASFNHAQTLCRERREMWVRSTQRSVHFLSSWPRQLPTLHSQFQSDFRSFSTSILHSSLSTLLIVNRQSLIVNCQKALLYAFALHKLHNYSLTLPKNFT